MNVPAWPIPTHQTKLMMANPHATGMSMPQMPTPLANRYTAASDRIITNVPASAIPAIQPLAKIVMLDDTGDLIGDRPVSMPGRERGRVGIIHAGRRAERSMGVNCGH